MMPLENQLVCQELSMKMKELGFKQESLFYYYPRPKVLENSGGKVISDGYKVLFGNEARAFGKNAIISAYTVAELGEMLPKEIPAEPYNTDSGLLVILKGEDVWVVKYEDVWAECSKTLANAMAKMLIYLKENNLI